MLSRELTNPVFTYIAFGASHTYGQWHIGSDGFYTERAERSLQAPLPKMSQNSPPKKCREASTTVVLNQGSTKSFQGFGGRYPIF